jgi:hypothetical protein
LPRQYIELLPPLPSKQANLHCIMHQMFGASLASASVGQRQLPVLAMEMMLSTTWTMFLYV